MKVYKFHYALFMILLGFNPLVWAADFSVTEIGSGEVVLPWAELKKILEELEVSKRNTALKKLLEELETLKRNQAKTQDKLKEKPVPIPYSVTEAHFVGEVEGQIVRFEADLGIQVLTKSWVTIPLLPNTVGIEDIHIKSTTSSSFTQLIRQQKNYSLLTQGPNQLTIQVVFYMPLQVKDSIYELNFLPPPAVINHFALRIPQKSITVVQAAPLSQIEQQKEITIVKMVLSERDPFQLQWKVKKESGLTRKSSALFHTLASIDKSDMRLSTTLVLKHISALETITFSLPLAVEIINVTSSAMTQWSAQKLAEEQEIKIAGQVGATTQIKIHFTYRLRFETLPLETRVPILKIRGVDHLEGFLGVEVLGNLEVNQQAVKNGISIPAKNLPKVLWQEAASPLLYGYQFYTHRFQSAVNIRRYQEIQTVIANVDRVDCVTHRTLEGKSMTRIVYFIRNNDRQFLSLTLPKNSTIWQTFLDGQPVKPAQKESGEILIPMKKSTSQGEELQSFSIEMGYISEVNKLSLKGDILNQLPAIDIPISYLKWQLYLPEYYEYSQFEGPLKQVTQFSIPNQRNPIKAQIEIPTQGQRFLFEKHLIVSEKPYVRGKYGQFLGDDIFFFHHSTHHEAQQKQQVILNR